ncbi:sporulation protein YpjB [Halobacillus shinanisalinarum]|uniref:Sporulation protein YpjB n=1 Tax=Halobacillus shinanisalinarum TaxID=2932258 RepID=A0ABY4GZE3_9BACI|nr:sporulation protein YpjB [Halobacillus shinanisalinarum]UOQ93566.1 sporulation protein YpjB [Halobacillus shinanisalinarum]
MGRAILICFVVSLSLWIPNNGHHKYIHAEHNTWSSFTEQYRHLYHDEKYELANRMLNNRQKEMEQYISTLSNQHQEMFNKLIDPIISVQSQEQKVEVEKFLSFINAMGSDHPQKYARQELQTLRNQINQIDQIDQDRASFVNNWKALLPTLQLYFDQKELSVVTQSVAVFGNSEMLATQQDVVRRLDKLLEDETPVINYDAFIWTAVIIGCTILITLIYVGARKYVAEKKEKKTHDKLNS